jgi:hypothetical protein
MQLFSYIDLERRIPLDHPLRAIRALIDKVLAGQSWTFTKLYARDGRSGIPPEPLLRALLPQKTLCYLAQLSGIRDSHSAGRSTRTANIIRPGVRRIRAYTKPTKSSSRHQGS